MKNEKLLFSTRRKGRRKRKRKKREERRRKGEEENRQSSSLSLVLETHTHTRSRLARGPPRSTEVNQVIPRRGRSNHHHQKKKEKDEEKNRFLPTLVCSLSLTHSLSVYLYLKVSPFFTFATAMMLARQLLSFFSLLLPSSSFFFFSSFFQFFPSFCFNSVLIFLVFLRSNGNYEKCKFSFKKYYWKCFSARAGSPLGFSTRGN